MKKVLYFLMAAVLCFAVVSCKKGKTVELNFEKCWSDDYAAMVEEYGDTAFQFYYAEARMNQNIDEMTTIDSVEFTKIETLFQAGPKNIVKFTHKDDGTVKKSTIKGTWLECMNINPDSVCMTLLETIDMVIDMECVKPHSNIVVMRCPLYPPFNVHPYYIFGTPRMNMSVNSCDDMPEPPVNDTI